MRGRDVLMDVTETVCFALLALFTAGVLLAADPGARPHTHDGRTWHAHPGVK